MRRSGHWVENEFEKIFRRELQNIKEHLQNELTNDEICTEVKNGNLTIEKFENLKEEDRNILE